MEVTMQRMLSVMAGFAVLLLAGCGSFNLLDSKKVDYRTTGSAPSLEVPPDLTMPAFDDRYRDRPGSATASGLAAGAQPARSGVLPVLDAGRIERAGTQRWLVVQGSPEATWNMVREFWLANGFTMALERPDLGIMETDWAENKALLPQNWFRRQLGKVIDIVYDTGERDRFRTRIERGTQPGTVEIFHQPSRDDGSPDQKRRPRFPVEDERAKSGARSRDAAASAGAAGHAGAGRAKAQSRNRPRSPPAKSKSAPTACRCWRLTIRSTGRGAGSGWRSTGSASPWSIAIAPRACISCATSTPTARRRPRRTKAGSQARVLEERGHEPLAGAVPDCRDRGGGQVAGAGAGQDRRAGQVDDCGENADAVAESAQVIVVGGAAADCRRVAEKLSKGKTWDAHVAAATRGGAA